jgi:dihydrofolate reductase
MDFVAGLSLYLHRSTVLEENDMTATYTFDVFSSLDGYASHDGHWGAYWGKQGPELLDHRLSLYSAEQRIVFGANTFREFTQFLASDTEESDVADSWVTRMRSWPATVVSTTLKGPLDWPNATIVRGDVVDVVARLKEESDVPLRSHGSLSLNRALMAASLVDRMQVTLFPVITGQTGWNRSSRVRPTSTWNCSRTGRSTVTSKSSSTDPPCIDLSGFEEDPSCLHPSTSPSPCVCGASDIRTRPDVKGH